MDEISERSQNVLRLIVLFILVIVVLFLLKSEMAILKYIAIVLTCILMAILEAKQAIELLRKENRRKYQND